MKPVGLWYAFYQDYAGKEINALIELPDGNWCGIEIRLGANKIDEAAANLIHIHRNKKSELDSSIQKFQARGFLNGTVSAATFQFSANLLSQASAN